MAFNETIPNNYIKEVTIEYSSECLPSLSENSNQQEIMNFSNSEKSQAFSDLNQDNFYNIKSKSKSKLSTQIMTPLSNPHREDRGTDLSQRDWQETDLGSCASVWDLHDSMGCLRHPEHGLQRRGSAGEVTAERILRTLHK